LPTATAYAVGANGPPILQRRTDVGYYKRTMPAYHNRNAFLKRLRFRILYIKPWKITLLACSVMMLAGVVMALFVANILPENFAENLSVLDSVR
jgi:hypothetical protein